ncbi:MAG: MTAP family purine nucleoside phosphorylase [Bacteroidales bacterium]|nr:MTAP family purine nucleoside phosphorylase [Bacteroidales bacterium]
MVKIALIIGYGPQQLPELNLSESLTIGTPYGNTSSPVFVDRQKNKEIYVIYRHGVDKRIPSFKVNYKANIYALYELGIENILATSVCGSLQEEICPGEFVAFDQFINLSTHRELTFSDKIDISQLNHSSLHKPFSDDMRNSLIEASIVNGFTTHTKGIVLAVDGPRQSTRAESNLYRRWGADVVNTTTVPEAILAHELNLKYGAISLCTYYDSWRTDIPPASHTEKMDVAERNKDKLHRVLMSGISNIEIDEQK